MLITLFYMDFLGNWLIFVFCQLACSVGETFLARIRQKSFLCTVFKEFFSHHMEINEEFLLMKKQHSEVLFLKFAF